MSPPSETVNVRSLVGDILFRQAGDDSIASTSSSAILDGQYVGLYFSRAFAPACFRFTPKLVDAYRAEKAKGTPFEVVLVPMDASREKAEEQFSTMPWASLPYGSPQIQALVTRFAVAAPPVLVMISPEGEVLSKDARLAVKDSPADFPWKSVVAPFVPESFMQISAGTWIKVKHVAMYLVPVALLVFQWWYSS